MSNQVNVLRIRKNVPGIGRKLATYFNANEITALSWPKKRIQPGAVVINYGNSNPPVWYERALNEGVRVLNAPGVIQNASNKLHTLGLLTFAGVPSLEWTTDRLKALEWLKKGDLVYARTSTTGKQGKGIVLMRTTEDFVSAPLYTKGFNQTHEYRVHVVEEQCIDLVQKKRMGRKKLEQLGIKEADMFSRNHKRGWVFAHNDIHGNAQALDYIKEIGCQAVTVCGLDFGAADILAKVNEAGVLEKAVVCEVNSAPGMSSPTTFKRYAEAFETIIDNHQGDNQ